MHAPDRSPRRCAKGYSLLITQEMMIAMIRAPIRNKDNERVCDVILYEKTSKAAIVTKEGRQTRYIDYEELKEKVESLKTTTE